jgi:NAD-dependent deacetylase
MFSCVKVAAMLRGAKRVVALTGAGISVESGITPFRSSPPAATPNGRPATAEGATKSIWGTFDASKMTAQYFNARAGREGGDDGTSSDAWEGAREWWRMKHSLIPEVLGAAPNAAHDFFRLLEDRGQLECVVTQNIDRCSKRLSKSFLCSTMGHLSLTHTHTLCSLCALRPAWKILRTDV